MGYVPFSRAVSLPRTPATSRGAAKAQFVRRPLHPVVRSVRPSASRRYPNAFQFLIGRQRIHDLDPATRQIQRARSEKVTAHRPFPRTRPWPIFGSFNQVGAQGVRLGVPKHVVVIGARLNDEAPESALIHAPASLALIAMAVVHCVTRLQPVNVRRKFPVLEWPKHQVPVVVENAEPTEAHRRVPAGAAEKVEKRAVIPAVSEDPAAFGRAIDDVIDVAARCYSTTPWHDRFADEIKTRARSAATRVAFSILRFK